MACRIMGVLVVVLASAVAAGPASAQEPGAPRPGDVDDTEGVEVSPYRNPTGSCSVTGVAGLGFGSQTTFAFGAGVGYAVVTGVMPGVRGLMIVSDGLGGELAGTLTLTPPLSGSWTPFLIGEAGRRWEPGFTGWLYGVGGGFYLGQPNATFVLQLGWVQRWWALTTGETISFGSPLIGVAIRF